MTDVFGSLHSGSAQRNYKRCGTNLVTFIVGACLGGLGEKVQVEITDKQKVLAQRFYDSVQKCDSSEASPLQDLLYLFFTQWLGDQSAYTLPVYQFFMFYSFRLDGSMEPCNSITQIISRIVFFVSRPGLLFAPNSPSY